MSAIHSRLLELAIQIQQIPAPTFGEGPRAEFVQRCFTSEGLQDISRDEAGNIIARLTPEQIHQEDNSRHGNLHPQQPPLVISAHLDTVFSQETDLTVRREQGKVYGPGIGDNSLGVASLIGLIWALRERQAHLKGDVWLAADVGEEGLGDLCGMRALVDRFGSQVRGYLVVEGLALGHVYRHAVGVRRYRIRAETAGGHAWSDYGQPSAVHELAALITKITSVHISGEPRSTLNVGTMHGGTGINVLAAGAECELDLRSESGTALQELAGRVEGLIREAIHGGLKMEFQIIGQRPAGQISWEHPFIKLAKECLVEQGIEAVLTSGSTDANLPLSRGLPATVLGVTTGGGAHSSHEYIDCEPIEKGLEQLVRFVERVWE